VAPVVADLVDVSRPLLLLLLLHGDEPAVAVVPLLS
jgi:hypothetical protein